jgi:hypothetical protein
MEAIWKLPKIKVPEYRRIYRGQGRDLPLLPKLFRRKEPVETLRAFEFLCLNEFKERCLYLLPSVPEYQYDMMSLAQHYGLPTRLLDWSSNPLTALFFAVESVDSSPTVYVYECSLD